MPIKKLLFSLSRYSKYFIYIVLLSILTITVRNYYFIEKYQQDNKEANEKEFNFLNNKISTNEINLFDRFYHQSNFSNHLLNHIDSLERRVRTQDNVLLSIAENNHSLKEQICKDIVYESADSIEIAEAYHCLAVLKHKKNDQNSIFQAIRYESLALEAFYKEDYLKNLLFIITDAEYNVIPSDFDEYAFLTNLSKSSDENTSSKALYRMSLINSLGRTSSKKELKYNLVEAAFLKQQVQSKLEFKETKSIDTLFTLDNNKEYLDYAKATFASILLNADLDSVYNFYVMEDAETPISMENKKILDSLHHLGKYKLTFLTNKTELYYDKNGNSFCDSIMRNKIQKLILADVLPHLDSVIFLDVDLIILRDLYDLQHINNSDNFIYSAATENFLEIYRKDPCHFSYSYINSGVIVENLKLMREKVNPKELVGYFKDLLNNNKKECLMIPNQDTFNIRFKDQFNYISRRWNYLPVYDYSIKFMPFIIHFAGTKPSLDTTIEKHELYKKYNQLYYEYYNLTNAKF